MAIEEFWISVRTAAGLMVPKAAVDSPRLDRGRIETILRGATFWLTPGSVKGYNPKDFEFLSEEERTRLDEGMREFKAVAESVPRQGPATDEQIKDGVLGFSKIIEVVRPDKYADFDAFVIGKKIENLVRDELPDWVREMVFETGYDSSGAPALWIWVEVEDEAAREDSIENFLMIRRELTAAGAQVCPDRWVYVRMRTVSEQRPKAERRPKARSKTK
jgi:hypothetical protein